MALQISETWPSGSGSLGKNGGDEYSAFVWGDPDKDNADDVVTVVLFALARFSMLSPMGHVFSDFERVRQGPGRWIFTAKYKTLEANRQTNDASFSFTIGGGTQHISNSIKTQGKYVPATLPAGFPDAPDFGGAINVSGTGADQTIGGVDIHVPAFNFKTTFYVPPHKMTTAYVDELRTSCACVNNDVVSLNVDGIQMTWQPGELLLLGVDGQKRIGFGDWELGMSWNGTKNLSNITIGTGVNAITVIQKNGQDYMWAYYGPQFKSTTDGIIRKPATGIYVEQVYEYVPLSGILPSTDFGLANAGPWVSPVIYGGGGYA